MQKFTVILFVFLFFGGCGEGDSGDYRIYDDKDRYCGDNYCYLIENGNEVIVAEEKETYFGDFDTCYYNGENCGTSPYCKKHFDMEYYCFKTQDTSKWRYYGEYMAFHINRIGIFSNDISFFYH